MAPRLDPRPGPRRIGRANSGRPAVSLAVVALALLFVLPPGAAGTGVPAPPSGPPRVAGTAPGPLVRPAGSVGSVLGTYDVATNETFVGLANSLSSQYAPSTAVLDPDNDRVYVRGALGEDLSVVDPATHTDLADVGVPYAQQTYVLANSVAVDTHDDYLYLANANAENVTIVDGATDAVTGSIPTVVSPYSDLYDPATGNVYLADFVAGEVTVLNASSNRTVATIGAGTEPAAMLLDPASGRLFVANFGSANVSVIDAASDAVVGSVSVGVHPVAMVLDTVDDFVDVVSEGASHGSLSVLNASSAALVGNVTVGSEPDAAAFVAGLDRVFVANGASSNLTEVNDSAVTVVRSIPTGSDPGPGSVAFDAGSGDLYIAGYESDNITIVNPRTGGSVGAVGTGRTFPGPVLDDAAAAEVLSFDTGTTTVEPNVTVVDTATNAPVASVPLATDPAGIAFVAGTGTLYAANPAGDDTYRLGGDPASFLGVSPGGPSPTVEHPPVVYDPRNRDLYVADPSASTVDVLGPGHAFLTSIPVGLLPVSLAYDPTNGYVYAGSDYDGNVSVINGATNLVVGTLTIKMYDSVSALGVDPQTNALYVADDAGSNVTVYGATNLTRLSVASVGLAPTAFAYDPENATMFVATPESSNVSILSGSTGVVVGAIRGFDASDLLYDNASNVLYLALQYGYGLAAINATTYAALSGSPLFLGTAAQVAGLALDAADHLLYVSLPLIGAIEEVGTTTSYAVNFTETGLPVGTSWSVEFAGGTLATTGTGLAFSASNGSWPFAVGPVPGYTPNVTAGNVVVAGAPTTVPILFTANATGVTLYPVDFVETGLPGGTTWAVTYAGNLRSSSTTTVLFDEPNGSYSFAVGTVPGYSADPASGPLPVAGSPVTEPVAFSATSRPPGPPTVGLSADPTSVPVGTQTVLTATVSGASEPYTYEYTGLPPGCSSANATVVDCTPTATGPYEVTVHVSNGSTAVGSAVANLTVTAGQGSPSPNGGGSSSIGSYWWLLLVLLAVVVAIFAVAWWRRRRDATTTPGSPAPGPSGPPPSGPPPG